MGAIIAPLNPAYKSDALSFYFQDSKPKAAKKTTTKSTARVLKYDSSKEYKLRLPKSSWVLFNAHNIALIKNDHPNMQLGQRTKVSSVKWNAMDVQARERWTEAAAREKLKWQKVKKQLEENGNDFSKIPGRWLQIKKKTKKTEKDGEDEKSKKSPKKKKKATSPKKKKVVKKKTKKKKK